MRAGHRERKVIGATLDLQVAEDREIEFVVGLVDSATQRFAALYHPQHRVMLVWHHIGDLVRDEGLYCLPGVTPPDKRSPEELRVQRTAVHRQSGERKACREHPPSEFVNCSRTRRNL